MSEAKGNKGVKIRLEGVRHTFTYLFEQYTNKEGKRSYRDTFLITPGSEQDKAIRAAISQAARNAWGENAVKMIGAFKDEKNKFCYRDGNKNVGSDGEVLDGFAGMMYLAANSKTQPTLKNEKNENIEELGKGSGKLFSGAYVTAIVEIWPQTGTNSGIRCQVQGVRHDRDGVALGGGGRRASDDEFGPPPGNPDEDLVGGNPDSDDIPF